MHTSTDWFVFLCCSVLLQVVLASLLAVIGLAQGEAQCARYSERPRPHSVTITEFGAVGDGLTVNTVPFQNAIFYLRSFADKGGAQLYVPKGRWLTGSFNLTSHLTLFLEKDAVIIGIKVVLHISDLNALSFYQHQNSAVLLIPRMGCSPIPWIGVAYLPLLFTHSRSLGCFLLSIDFLGIVA